MQRTPGIPSFAATLAVALSASLVALPAQAQLIQREADGPKPADKGGPGGKAAADAASDDDDILAPLPTDKDDKAAAPAPAKAKAFKIGVVPLIPLGDAGKPVADEVTSGLVKQLGESAVFEAVPLAVDVKSGGGATVDEGAAREALKSGTATLDKARALLAKLQFGKAKKGFELALEQLEKAAPVLAEPQPLIDARVGLAEVAARQGQESETEIQLAYAAVLNPEVELDKKKFPPQFVRTHQKMRDKALQAERATIVVDATGAGASVEVDGRATAGAPVKVTEVPPGRHLVRALREGLPSFGTIVEVKAGESVTVSPGFVATDGKSYVDDLQNNRLSPEAAKAVAEAAKAAGHKGAVVGVVSKTATSVLLQLVLVDATSGGFTRLPQVTYQAGLLDISIETLKAREPIEDLYTAEKPDPAAFGAAALATLLEGAKAGAAVETTTVALRYDVRAARERPRSRLVTGDKGDAEIDDERTVLSAGKSGKRQRLDDEEDPYANRKAPEDAVPDPDAPLTEQGWFWPTVLGGGAAAAVVISGATVIGLIGAGVLPDPRPANGGQVTVTLP